MSTKKDIGDIIEDTLNMAQKTPSDALWARVDASLEKKRKRRGLLFLWLGIGTIGLLTVIGLNWPTTESTLNNKLEVTLDTEIKNCSTEEITVAPNASEIEKASKDLEDDSLVDPSVSEENLSNTEEISEEKMTTDPINDQRSLKSSKSTSSNDHKSTHLESPFDSATTVSQTYYYYDGEKEIQTEITDKSVLDSIIEQKNVSDKVIKKTVSDSVYQKKDK